MTVQVNRDLRQKGSGDDSSALGITDSDLSLHAIAVIE